jgi:hypothetical protein
LRLKAAFIPAPWRKSLLPLPQPLRRYVLDDASEEGEDHAADRTTGDIANPAFDELPRPWFR